MTNNINWPFIVLGIVSLLFAYQKSNSFKSMNLVKEEVTLKGQMINVKRTRTNTRDYRFWTTEHSNRFEILKGSMSRERNKELEGIKEGTPMTVYLSSDHYSLLSKSNKNVTLRGLYLNETPIFTPNDYKSNRIKYHHRIYLLGVFIGFMFLINGLLSVPTKANLILVILAGFTFLILRYFELLLY